MAKTREILKLYYCWRVSSFGHDCKLELRIFCRFCKWILLSHLEYSLMFLTLKCKVLSKLVSTLCGVEMILLPKKFLPNTKNEKGEKVFRLFVKTLGDAKTKEAN